MTYEEAIAFIHSVSWRGSRPGLSRITELLARLGNPERDLRAVHVAGTNGKGSFCAMTESILRRAGYRTGLFVSPYIEFFEERIQTNGRLIPREDLAAVVGEVADACRTMTDPPTEFELLTAVGFLYFARQKVEVAVVECGLGGRLDSTNVLPRPLLSVITGVSLDHTEILGDTVEKIAAEKAGILKPGCPALYGGRDRAAAAVIAETAKRLGCPLKVKTARPRNVGVSLAGTTLDYKAYRALRLPLLGSYQPENAATVLEAVPLLRRQGLTIPAEAVRDGLAAVSWKGRFEKLADRPPVFFDGGHNPEGVAAAVETVRALFGDDTVTLITGVMRDKAYPVMAETLSGVAAEVFTVSPDNPRALAADDYAAVFRRLGVAARPCADYREAVEAALSTGRPVLCVGSLYAYAAFKAALKERLSR